MLQNQILELRRDLQALQQRGSPPPSAYYRGQGGIVPGGGELEAQLLDRVQVLEDQVRRLRGQLDEQVNALRRSQEDLAKQVADLNFRLQNGAAPATVPAPAAFPGAPARPSAPEAAPPAAGTPRRTPELALQEGNAALARRDYTAAESAAREVLGQGRTTPRAADANYLLAQALMGQRNYQGAAVAYDDAYNRAPKSARAADALLGLANALTGLNERPAVCATLDKLHREFPKERAGVKDAAAVLRKRNGCS